MTKEDSERLEKLFYHRKLNRAFGHQFITFHLPNNRVYYAIRHEMWNRSSEDLIELKSFHVLRHEDAFRVNAAQFEGLQWEGYLGGTNIPLFYIIKERREFFQALKWTDEQIEKNMSRKYPEDYYNEYLHIR